MADAIVQVEYEAKCKVTETLDVGLDNVSNLKHILQLAGVSGTLTPSTTVPVTTAWIDTRTMAGTSETLDLTALVRANLPDVDLTGLKIQVAIIVAATANTGTVTLADGATNGYNLFGDASGQVTLEAGEIEMRVCNDKRQDVSATVKTIDVTGSSAGQSYSILLVAG